jgi:hypothetical protein
MKKSSTRGNAPRSSAGDFGRLKHKPRKSHSFEKEMNRIERSTSKFSSLDGGGKSGLKERGHDETRPKHQDLFNRFTGNLKGGKTDEAK